MSPNKTQWRWILNVLGFLSTCIWWLLSAPFRLLGYIGKKIARGWQLLNAGLDWCWDWLVFLLGKLVGLLWFLIGPIARPLGELFLRFIGHPLADCGRFLLGWADRLTLPARRFCSRQWQRTQPFRTWLGASRVGRPVVNVCKKTARVWNVIKPYWMPHGWLSALGFTAVAAATVGAYFGLQVVAGSMDMVTKAVMDALAPGYWHFALHYVLPGMIGLRLVMFVGKKLWPKNANADGFLLLFGLLLLMLSVNTLNVILNFANGAITDAMNHKDQAMFTVMVIRLLMCFAIGTGVVVLYSFVRNRLALSWRRWFTYFVMEKYFFNRNYYRINYDPDIDNPDERIQQDIDGFVSGALSILLTVLGSIITYYTFVGILRDVDPTGWLTTIAYVWSLGFTVVAIGFFRRLVGLNFQQSKKEADFRYQLIHVRKYVESIAFYHSEDRESGVLKMRFKEVLLNWSQLIGWTRNLGFVQTGADYFTVAIPFLIMGPLYFAGQVEMGDIGRAAMAFGQVLSALTLVVTEFASISIFLARIERLGTFVEKLDTPDESNEAEHIQTQVSDHLSYNNVTLMTPNRQRTLVAGLDLTVEVDSPVLVMGPSGSGKSSMLRALAGLPQWNRGKGMITRPDLGRIMFLPQVPYMLIGNLRDQLLYRSAAPVSDAQLDEVLRSVNLPDLKDRVGGYDTVLPWADVLSPGEQQRLAFARLLVAKPDFAILDEATSALDEVNEENVYATLHRSRTTYASVGHRPSLRKYHRRILRLDGKGGWEINDSLEWVSK